MYIIYTKCIVSQQIVYQGQSPGKSYKSKGDITRNHQKPAYSL